MAKLTLSDAASEVTPTLYNRNNEDIEAAFDNTLSRDGTSPNVMAADIDMDSNDLLNVGTIQVTSLKDSSGGEVALSQIQEFVDIANNAALLTTMAGITYPSITLENANYLKGQDTSGTAHNLLGVNASNEVVVGASALPLNFEASSLSASGRVWSDLGSVTTADINGGTIDGVAIGGSTPAAGAFTTLSTSAALTVGTSLAIANQGAGSDPVLSSNSASQALSLSADTFTVSGASANIGTQVASDSQTGRFYFRDASGNIDGYLTYNHSSATPASQMQFGVQGGEAKMRLGYVSSAAVLRLGVDASTQQQIIEGPDDGVGSIRIQGGGATTGFGANAQFYGDSHATLANDFGLYQGGNAKLYYDHSASLMTISPPTLFEAEVKASYSSPVLSTQVTADNQLGRIYYRDAAGNIDAFVSYAHSGASSNANTLQFGTAGGPTAKMTLDGSGNLAVVGNMTTSGFLRLNDGIGSELTISSGAITATGSYHYVDTEGDAASDDLDTVNGGSNSAVLVLSAANAARTVVLKDNTGNLRLAGDFSMDNISDFIMLMYLSGNWYELSRSNNG